MSFDRQAGPMAKIKVLVIPGMDPVGDWMADVIKLEQDMAALGLVRDLGQALETVDRLSPEVILVDIDIPPNYGPRYTREFAGLYASVARNSGATLLPDFLAAVGTDPDLMQSDGIHPNSLAQPMLVDAIWPVLARLLGAKP